MESADFCLRRPPSWRGQQFRLQFRTGFCGAGNAVEQRNAGTVEFGAADAKMDGADTWPRFSAGLDRRWAARRPLGLRAARSASGAGTAFSVPRTGRLAQAARRWARDWVAIADAAPWRATGAGASQAGLAPRLVPPRQASGPRLGLVGPGMLASLIGAGRRESSAGRGGGGGRGDMVTGVTATMVGGSVASGGGAKNSAGRAGRGGGAGGRTAARGT